MVLDRKNRKFFVLKAFDGPIVQIDVRDLEVGRSGDAFFVSRYCKPVILGRNQHTARLDFSHRMISSAMSVRHFHGFRPESEP